MLDGGIAHGGVTFHIRGSHTAEALAKTVGNGSDHRAAGPNQVQQVKRNADDHTLPGRNGAIFDDPMQSLEWGGKRTGGFWPAPGAMLTVRSEGTSGLITFPS